MAARTWIGGTSAVAQVWTAVVTGYDAATTYTITVTGEDGTTTTIDVAGTTDADGTATALRAAWNASTHKLVTPIAASGTGANVILTADTAGVPFIVASSVASGTGTFGAFTVTTANAGQNDYGTPANWQEGAVPVASDDVLIDGTYSILYGLNRAAVELDDFIVAPSYSGTIGRAGAPLKIDMADTDRFEFSGLGQAWINLGTAAPAVKVFQTYSPSQGDAGLWLSGGAIGSVTLYAGDVRIYGASTVAGAINTLAGSNLYIEAGNTIATIDAGGSVTTLSAFTSSVVTGSFLHTGAGTATTVTTNAGESVLESSGTVTNIIANGGVTDQTTGGAARTATNTTINGGEYRFSKSLVTHTNPIGGTGVLRVSKV